MILDGIIIWDPYRFMKIDHLRSQKHFQNFMSYRFLKVLDLSLDLNMAQAMANIQRWNCSIYLPMFGIQAMTGPITLIANG